MQKKGVSPVIATVLLILITIIIAVIILLWARSFIGESIEKSFGGATEPIQHFCSEVDFVADVAVDPDNSKRLLIDITNRKDVPIYGIEVRQVSSSSKVKVGNLGIASDSAVTSGETERIAILGTSGFLKDQTFSITPALLGEVESGARRAFYICEDKYGVEETSV